MERFECHTIIVRGRLQAAITMVADGQKLLVQLHERLQKIRNRLLDIEARFDALDTGTEGRMTLREFTEKQIE
jgi:hypothetical protein